MDAWILRLPDYRTRIGSGPDVVILQVTPDGIETELEGVKTTVSHQLSDVAQDQIQLGHQRLILDLSTVTQMDTQLLGLIIAAYVRAENLGGKFVLANPRPKVVSSLETANIGSVLLIFDSVLAAVQHFNS